MTIPAGICSGANASRPGYRSPAPARRQSARCRTAAIRRRAARNAPYAAPSSPQNPGCRRRRRWPRSAAPGRKAQHRQLLQTYAEADGGPVAQQRHVRRPGGTEQDDGPGQRQQKPPPAAAVAACRLPASQIIAVCTSRTSAVVIKMPTAAAGSGDADAIKIKRGREQSRASVRPAGPPLCRRPSRQRPPDQPTAGKNSTSARTTMLAPL